MNLSRVLRLLRLIGLLQGGRGYNIEGLAQQCEVSRRTIFRDLDLLRQAGIPLRFDEQSQQYGIPGSHFLPPTNFTPEEALALIVLCHELGDSGGLPFFAPARSAAIKLESNLPPRLREQLRGVADAVRIQPPPSNPLNEQQAVFDRLLEALGRRRAARIVYRSFAEGETIRTKLSPYRLLFSRRSWYAIGRSSLHRSTRTFNVGRLQEVVVLDEAYEIPRGFSVERYLRNAWHLIPERGRDHEVHVRFSPMVAGNVAEVQWHRTQRVAPRADGGIDFFATVSGLGEISWWILGYGDQAEVIAPAELRQRVAGSAQRMAARYRGE